MAPAADHQLKEWVAEDSESHRSMLALHEKLMDEQERMKVLDMLEADETDTDLKPGNKLRIFGDRTRIALLDAVLEAGTGFDGQGINGLSKNVFDDLLAKGTAVRNKRGAHVILRLVTMHLQEWWSVKLLKESLMAYASSMSADQSNMSSRALMWTWSFKLLEILKRLALVPHRSSSGVKIALDYHCHNLHRLHFHCLHLLFAGGDAV